MRCIVDQSALTSLQNFKPFKARLENYTGETVKCVRSDGGTEYLGEFRNFLIEQGITHQQGPPYRKHIPPEAERSHRTILNWGRANHYASKLPMKYYNEAQKFAAHLFNVVVHSGANKSPWELMLGKPYDFDKIRPFGCVGYAFFAF